ncbi:nucleotidyltransferase domain-containing protein [Candidatus Daviesbacteria bacterium]|nr:nucleotidyltransferase domain-containing protein [Candidatus Daviesbacteria bacterium]
MILFDSAVTGTMTPDSDLDFLVESTSHSFI